MSKTIRVIVLFEYNITVYTDLIVLCLSVSSIFDVGLLNLPKLQMYSNYKFTTELKTIVV